MDTNKEDEKILDQYSDSEANDLDTKEEKQNDFQNSTSGANFAVYSGNELLKKKKAPKLYCRFKKYKIKYIDYKNVDFLLKFVNEQGKILPRRFTGNSLKYQKKVALAIKRARHLALLPFVTDNLK